MNQRAIRDAFIARGDTFVIGGDKGGDCYQYKEGIYKSDGKAVRRQIESMVNVDSLISHKTIGDCYNFITDSEELRKYPQDLNSDKNLINFKNGVWNIETQELLPHDQKYLQTIQVPHEVLKADKPWEKTRIYRFLSEKCKLQEEDINMIADFMAYCLTLKPLKAFMSLYGPSNTGKTVLITFMEKLVGQENVSSVTMKQLSKDKWHTAQLMDKLLNSSGDENTADLPGVDELKRVTGSDNITNEKKGKDPFYFKPFVKLVYSFNMLPLQRGDKSDAYFKRLRVLNMNTVLELDEDFVDELHSELSIREAIPHLLDRLPLKGISNSPRSLKLVETLRQDSDSIHAFISKKCVEGKNETVEKKRLFLEYKTFCADNQLDAYGLQEFYRLLKSKGYKEIRGKAHEYSFKGIGLKSKGGRRK
jgi:putative DNA primase/helicase